MRFKPNNILSYIRFYMKKRKGLMEQIGESNITYYEDLKQEDIDDILSDLCEKENKRKRNKK